MAHYLKQRLYGRDELLADGLVHSVAIVGALFASGFVLSRALAGGALQAGALAVYVLGLLAMLGFSMAYNLTPHSPLKWVLRRFDHSAIYLMIAGTYTPLLLQLQNTWFAAMLGAVVWGGALVGIGIKTLLPGRFDTIAIAAYLLLGWVGVLAAHAFWQVLPGVTLVLIPLGGLLYSAGVPFYLWERLKFQNAIWHGFVVAAAACHFAGIAWLYVGQS
ncbi:MAG: hemolysin III family protein [Hyphomicrobiales bacterium]